jgi:D-alanyl-D-alanine carboxypeptidase/D-alanyl-D-alanine-endopeptidase (penicillin-binding protein 4)
VAAGLLSAVEPVAGALDEAARLPGSAEIQELAQATVGAERLTAASGTGATAGREIIPSELVGALGVSVRDMLTGEELYAADATRGLVPASTTKILTASAALATLGPEAVLTTRAVLSLDGPGRGTVTLVAGGDTSLGPDAGNPAAVMGRAGMGDLARAAAVEVRRAGLTTVAVALDDSLFTGAATYPDWEWNLGTTWGAPATPLAIMDGRAGEAFDAVTYVADPALRAAEHFAALLGVAAADTELALPAVAVDSGVTRAGAPAQAREIARVDSAPLRQLAAYLLQQSDNTLAEAVGRVTATARGLDGSFAGCAQGIDEALEELGVPAAGLHLDDCSGLSHGSRIPVSTLTAVLALAGSTEVASLGAVARCLPVGALQGTVAERFTTAPGAGNVRAKTGTLTGVTALAGLVQTAGGRELVFAVIVNPDPMVGTLGARQATDRFIQGLAALA